MAPFSKYISFLFFTALLLSLQINARDSQFFTKATHDNNNNNVKETELPNKEAPVNKPEQEPVFTPETESSYGLYGHESGQFPPSTTTTTTTTNDAPYTTTPITYEPESEQKVSKYTNKYYNYNKDSYDANQNELSNTRLTGSSYSSNNNKNNNYYYNKDSYGVNQNEIGNTRLTGRSYSSNNNNYYDNKEANGGNQNEFGNTRLTESSYSNNNNYYYNKDAYEGNQNEIGNTKYTEGEYNFVKNQNNNNNQNYHYNNAANYRNNGERKGMSDTRFVEGGKYYFHVNPEKHNPTLYGDSSRGVDSKNWYNNRGYFGNNNANSYENNNNNNNRYQNSEEFEDDQEEP